MATFEKRGTAWRVKVRRKGRSLAATFDTRAEAEAWAIQQEASILGQPQDQPPAEPKPRAATGQSAKETFLRYAQEVSPQKRGGRWEIIMIAALIRRHPGLFNKPIQDIKAPDIADWRDSRLRAVSAATVNRELCTISAVFSHAIREWRLGLAVNPCSLVSKPTKPKARTQRITPEQRDRIVELLGWDGASAPHTPQQWVALAFHLALATAMRKGEILSLAWEDIDFDQRHAHLSITKNGDSRNVPLSSAAIGILRIVHRPGAQGRIFPIYSGHFDKLFRLAKIAAGLRHIRFHDARREATTNMAAKLSNVLELAAITGHKSLGMLMVYYRPKPADLAAKLDL